MYPYVALRCPTYRENSHANHTWHQRSHETACFLVPAAPSPWVRFPSPAPSIFHGVPPTMPGRGRAFHRPLHSQAMAGHAGLDDWGQDVDPVGKSWETDAQW